MRQLLEVVHQAVELPLRIHFPLIDQEVQRVFEGAGQQLPLEIDGKRSIDIAIDDGGSDDVEVKPNGDSLPSSRAGGLRNRRRF
jgi:hypothetical protein